MSVVGQSEEVVQDLNEKEDTNQISKWLEADGWLVYWNCKNEYGWPVFNTKGISRKPDIVAIKNTVIVAIEMKSPTTGHIIKGHKIVDYCINYINKKTQYFIEGKKLVVNKFLLATRCSPKGKLHEWDQTYRPIGKGRQKVLDKNLGLLPQNEFTGTYLTTRSIWGEFGRRHKGVFDTEIGVLLSGCLDNKEPTPYSLIQYYNLEWHGRKQRWRPL